MGYATPFTRSQQPDVHATPATNMALCSLSAGVLNAGITVRYYGHFARTPATGTAALRASGCTCGKHRDGKTAGSLSTPATFALGRYPPRISLRRKGTRVGRREILPHDERFMDGNDTRAQWCEVGVPASRLKVRTRGPRMIINSRQCSALHARRFTRPIRTTLAPLN